MSTITSAGMVYVGTNRSFYISCYDTDVVAPLCERTFFQLSTFEGVLDPILGSESMKMITRTRRHQYLNN